MVAEEFRQTLVKGFDSTVLVDHSMLSATANNQVRFSSQERILGNRFSSLYRFKQERIARRTGDSHIHVERIDLARRQRARDRHDVAAPAFLFKFCKGPRLKL